MVLTMLQSLLIVLFMGAADRVRGDAYHLLFSRFSDKFAYGWLVAALMGHPWDIYTAPTIAAMAIGSSFGWGGAIGSGLYGLPLLDQRPAWWQVGPLRHNTWLALTVRGALWGACFLPIAWFDPRFLAPAIGFTVAFPLAVLLARGSGEPWENQELLRGWIAGALTLALLSQY
jgi:hypothetical protein